MRFIDVHDVGYGECIVFEGFENEIFMVDCGSMNLVLKNSDIKFKDYVVNFIIPRYKDAKEKNFLLTHFHKDHFCGLKYILKKESNYFDNIFIPYPIMDHNGQTLILEMAIYAFTFLKRQQTCSNISTNTLFIFEFLQKNSYAKKVYPLKRDDIFEFSDVRYKVLNPSYNSFPFPKSFINAVEHLNDLLRSSMHHKLVNEFFHLKDSFCQEYVKCSNLCREYEFLTDDKIDQSIKRLHSYIIDLNKLSRKLEHIDVTEEIVFFLNDEDTCRNYSLAQNSASIVFQSELQGAQNCKNILMTGDITTDILNLLENDLFPFYNVIKVPHHGTSNYQNGVLNNLNCSHLVISNGEYYAGGKISDYYTQINAIKHCTGIKNCDYLNKNKACCNRLLFCDSLTKCGDLTSHCKKSSFSNGINECNIYVVSSSKERGCYCD